jgi:hypothetical protein
MYVYISSATLSAERVAYDIYDSIYVCIYRMQLYMYVYIVCNSMYICMYISYATLSRPNLSLARARSLSRCMHSQGFFTWLDP